MNFVLLFCGICTGLLLFCLMLAYLDGKLTCSHEWKVLDKSYDASPMERLGAKSAKNVWPDAYQGTRMVILTCEKCGKLNKTIERV